MLWVDITNTPHVLFFKEFIKKHKALVTTRKFGKLTDLLDFYGIKYIVAGEHGGKNPRGKLKESANRIANLTDIVSKEDITIAISKQSVEMPRVAYGLRIPSIQVVDNEFAEEQNRLALSLCSRVIVPKALDYKKLLLQGAHPEKIRRFNGLCEAVQVKNFRPDKEIMDKFGLEDYAIVRPEPYMAAYFKSAGMTQKLINGLRKEGLQVLAVPRANERYKGAIMINGTDSLSLIYYAKIVLSGGGTMNRESALLGTPTISFYPQELLGVDRFLIKQGLMHHAETLKDATKLTKGLVQKKQELRKKAKVLINKMESPFSVIEKEISSL